MNTIEQILVDKKELQTIVQVLESAHLPTIEDQNLRDRLIKLNMKWEKELDVNKRIKELFRFTEDDSSMDEYGLVAIPEDIYYDSNSMRMIESYLNKDNREGFSICRVVDNRGIVEYYNRRDKTLLCVFTGSWG